jgi:hypothetical protein
MKRISGLGEWVTRRAPLEGYGLSDRVPDREGGCWVGIDIACPVHQATNFGAESLADSWTKVDNYVREALALIKSKEPDWLDREEAMAIVETLGDPPEVAYPLYFISVGTGEHERLVYVGKTSRSTSRFSGGHTAISKLHNPIYDGLAKTIYLGVLMLYDDLGYFPVEWVKPLDRAQRLLASVEAQLIFDLQPELNKAGKSRFNSSWPTPIFLENYSGYSNFLHGSMSFGPVGDGIKPYLWSIHDEENAPKSVYMRHSRSSRKAG